MKSFHEELRNENHYSSLVFNLTLVNKHIKGKVGKEQAKEIKKVLLGDNN